MISTEALEDLSKKHQMGVFPNIIREYFQHLFLAELYTLTQADQLLFKGGTALRVVYGSPRFSEDLDFSLCGVFDHEVKSTVEKLLVKVLTGIESMGVRVTLGERFGSTSGGYLGVFTFQMHDYPKVNVEINVSTRGGAGIVGEADSISNNFVPTYTLIHLPQDMLVEEKVFGALLERKKPRDYYDLYIIMRKGMLGLEQKQKLALIKDRITTEAERINFKNELGVFLPIGQQEIIKDFASTLGREINSQISELR